MTEVGVVHLVRRKNGIAPFERFIASYRACPAGVPHDLVLIFKGFAFGGGIRAYDRLLHDLPHQKVHVADRGFDLQPYFGAVKRFDYRYFCFLNSFSWILDSHWLAKLYRGITDDGVGLVGATGSYESLASNYALRVNMLAAMGPASRWRWKLNHVVSSRRPAIAAQRAIGLLVEGLGLKDPRRRFPLFPNYHVRTNAFMAARETLARVRLGPLLFKLSAYFFESGRDSLTRQVMGLGLCPLVVGRDGVGYEKEQWHLANTFWQGNQENLLIADNRTELYAAGDAAVRTELSRLAWGERGRPA